MNYKTKSFICPCCGYSGNWKKFRDFPQFLFGIKFSILKCPVCGIGKTNPTPQTDLPFYSENKDYVTLFTKNHDLYLSFAKDLFQSFANSLPKINGSRLLDVGSGSGEMVEYAKSLGYDAIGIEANKYLVKICHERDLQVIEGNVEMLDSYFNGRFDVVIFSAVLEHLLDPGKLLTIVHKNLLTDNGIIIISQANYKGLLPSLFPWLWYAWQPKQHFWHFTKNSINKISALTGFNVVKFHKVSLHHPFYPNILKPLDFFGRNIAAVFSAIGALFNCGDQVYAMLQSTSSNFHK